LYTLEQFAGVKKRLTSQGVYCQWLALHQMDNDTLRSIVGSFVQVYPNAVAVLANNSIDTPVIGLIGRGDDSGFFIRDIQVRLNSMNDSHLLSRSELRDTNSVLGVMVADSESLRHFAQSVPANTDDKPIVNHMAPWTTYLAASLPKQRLSELLNVLWIKPEAVIQELGSEDAKTYVAYWQARSAYLKLGMEISAMNDPQKILDQVQGRLLQILRNCPTYSPARTTLLQLANAVQLSDPSRAQALQASLNSIK
jgi:spermidine synthase